tara:strand:+ start:2854 stop:5187 length:2334 start_codon:yes stop_codon:yes gene_type:complete
MSYGLQYFTNFFDTDDNKYRLQIFQWQFTGTAKSNITLADNGVVINYRQNDDYFRPIIGSTCKMRFYVEVGTGGDNWEDEDTLWNEADFFWDRSELTFLLPENDRQYRTNILRRFASGESDTGEASQNKLKDATATFSSKVEVGDLVVNTTTGNYANVTTVDSNTLLTLDDTIISTSTAQNYEIYRKHWTGFIMQDSYTLPIASRPYAVEVVASDLIGTINGYNMDITTERPETFSVIQNCLKNINLQSGDGTSGRGLDFSYKVLCRINQTNSLGTTSSNDNPYTQTYLNSVDSLQDENGNYLDCKHVLESILRMFNCRIFQHENTWTIIDNASLALTSFNDTGSYSKEFKKYTKNGAADGTLSIANPVFDVNSTAGNDTIQPLNQDLVKIVRRPAIRQRTQVRIKDTLKSRFNNGGYEVNTSPSGGTPSYGRNPTDWTIPDRSIAYAVDSNAIEFPSGGGQPIQFGITPYAGDFSLITIGSTSSNTVVASNDTGNVGTTAEPIKLVFADYALDPDNTGLLAYIIKVRISIIPVSGGTVYWSITDNSWVSSATQGINTITGSVQEQWRFNEISMEAPPIVGSAKIEFFIPKEDAHNNSAFRIYYDDVVLQSISDLELYDTQTKIIDGSFKDNSGVLKAIENRFGMLDDSKYSNCLVDSAGNTITAYKSFDESSGATLETLMNFQRLNEYATNNYKYEGTFRKLPSSDGFTKPIDMLTFPKLAFSTLSDDNHQAIDSFEFNVAKNRYKLTTHLPTQSNLTNFGQIASFTDFYKHKPED